LKFHYDKDGYKRIGIIRHIDGKRLKSPVAVHRMVASTFLPEHDDELNVVNHMDGDKTNNYYKNLEWTTSGENTRHALRMGLQVNSGVNAPNAVYNEEVVRFICKSLESGMDCFQTYCALTGETKVTNNAIYALVFSIKSGKRHKEISSEYDIPNSVLSQTKKRFTKEEEDKIKEMILSGCKTTTIVKYFGGKTTKDKIGKRVSDKVRNLRKALGVSSTTRERQAESA
jgi:hypothetical protein